MCRLARYTFDTRYAFTTDSSRDSLEAILRFLYVVEDPLRCRGLSARIDTDTSDRSRNGVIGDHREKKAKARREFRRLA